MPSYVGSRVSPRTQSKATDSDSAVGNPAEATHVMLTCNLETDRPRVAACAKGCQRWKSTTGLRPPRRPISLLRFINSLRRRRQDVGSAGRTRSVLFENTVQGDGVTPSSRRAGAHASAAHHDDDKARASRWSRPFSSGPTDLTPELAELTGQVGQAGVRRAVPAGCGVGHGGPRGAASVQAAKAFSHLQGNKRRTATSPSSSTPPGRAPVTNH